MTTKEKKTRVYFYLDKHNIIRKTTDDMKEKEE